MAEVSIRVTLISWANLFYILFFFLIFFFFLVGSSKKYFIDAVKYPKKKRKAPIQNFMDQKTENKRNQSHAQKV